MFLFGGGLERDRAFTELWGGGGVSWTNTNLLWKIKRVKLENS